MTTSTDILTTMLAAYVDHLDEVTAQRYAKDFPSLSPPTHKVDKVSAGQKFARILSVETSSTAAVAFVALTDGKNKHLGQYEAGQIFKPDGFKRPARHARGSVLKPTSYNGYPHYLV